MPKNLKRGTYPAELSIARLLGRLTGVTPHEGGQLWAEDLVARAAETDNKIKETNKEINRGSRTKDKKDRFSL